MIQTDFLIIGSGVAGLSLALDLAGRGTVAIVTKKDLVDSNTNYAQGGVAAVMGPEDRFDLHVADTLEAGAGLCRRDVVEMVVREGPERIRSLMELGVAFTTEAGALGDRWMARASRQSGDTGSEGSRSPASQIGSALA